MFAVQDISIRLNSRRLELGLSCAALAKRTGLSLRTVQRIMSGEESDPGFLTVTSLAEALGATLHLSEVDAEIVRRRQAEQKAEQLLSVVQGTSALESQAVSEQTMRSLKKRTVIDLLAGSSRKLWAE